MTEPMVDDGPVEVIDADRATYLALRIFHTCEDRMIHAGWADESPEMQRIARHRLAGVAAGREGAVTYLRESAAQFRAEAVRQGKRPGPLARSFDDAAAAIEEDAAIRQRGE